jgi:3D-(3,5/4)-trihydroxycyclohexane-1,2-dione acylhydrolase (decyclizing)
MMAGPRRPHWWEVGTPHVTENPKVKAAHEEQEATRVRQRKGV